MIFVHIAATTESTNGFWRRVVSSRRFQACEGAGGPHMSGEVSSMVPLHWRLLGNQRTEGVKRAGSRTFSWGGKRVTGDFGRAWRDADTSFLEIVC